MPSTSAQVIVRALGGKWDRLRQHGMARCPAHHDKTPSLSVNNIGGLTLVKCFGGCSQAAVLDELRRRGLWGGETRGQAYDSTAGAPPTDLSRRISAAEIWDRGASIPGTHAHAYLKERGIKTPPSDQLRYVPSLRHPNGSSYPALLARISDNRGFCAVQRTWLLRDSPQKINANPQKATLGPMENGAVRLRPLGPSGLLGLSEGVETALSAAQLYSIPVWACLGAARLGKVELPTNLRSLVIFADAGDVGRQEAFKSAENYEHLGILTEIIFPQAHFKGQHDDFNSALMAGVRAN